MILLCGVPSETPLALVRDRLEGMNVPYVFFNQRQFAGMAMQFAIADGWVTGELQIAGQRYNLEDFTGVYTRLMDDQQLPELQKAPPNSPLHRHCRALHDTLSRWTEIVPLRVVNRAGPMVNGKETPTLAIRIYVAQKRDVPMEERLPKQIQEVPTDVIERRFVLH